jgi:hypothetical protein
VDIINKGIGASAPAISFLRNSSQLEINIQIHVIMIFVTWGNFCIYDSN